MNVNNTAILIGSIILSILLACGAFFTMGGIVNTGSSIPPGLYWKVDKPLAMGRTIIICPANQAVFQEARKRGLIKEGNCPDNFDKLLLKVVAKRKDTVTINESGVYVNEILLPQSKTVTQNKVNQDIPRVTLSNYELKENEVLVLSDSAEKPFDSRYFGPIEVDQIDSVISPLF